MQILNPAYQAFVIYGQHPRHVSLLSAESYQHNKRKHIPECCFVLFDVSCHTLTQLVHQVL